MPETLPQSAQTQTGSAVLIVDDHPILRQGLARLVESEPNLHVCAEAETTEQAVAAAETQRPALAIVDLSLGAKPNVDLIKQLRDRVPGLRVLVLSMHEESLWAARVLQAGACGYVMKQESPRVLIARVQQALRGETAVSESVSSALLRQLTWDRTSTAARPTGEESLGDRELQVLHLIGQGKSTRDTALELHISVKTVDAHREHIKRKLGLSTAAELIRYAVLKVERDGATNAL